MPETVTLLIPLKVTTGVEVEEGDTVAGVVDDAEGDDVEEKDRADVVDPEGLKLNRAEEDSDEVGKPDLTEDAEAVTEAVLVAALDANDDNVDDTDTELVADSEPNAVFVISLDVVDDANNVETGEPDTFAVFENVFRAVEEKAAVSDLSDVGLPDEEKDASAEVVNEKSDEAVEVSETGADREGAADAEGKPEREPVPADVELRSDEDDADAVSVER